MLHDAHTGERYAPIQHLSDATASFEVHNSPLSEYACVGFEYGYAVAAPEALVLWEAQFGDFVNGAQIMLDQFIVAGLSKWGETSRLTLLLPHGYEGNGPEHSSARLERFLQSTAQENIRVVNPSTAAQHFHVLRRQALEPVARPLVVMTPKGLLRLKEAASSLADLAEGYFQPVLDDPTQDKERTQRLVLCSGKVYYDIAGHELRGKSTTSAVARIEQLYPFPSEQVEGPRRLLPEPPGSDLGAGGAAEHGRVALDQAPPRGSAPEGRPASLRRPPLAGEPERGLPDGPPPRAGQNRPRSARRLGLLAGGCRGTRRTQRLRRDHRAVPPDLLHHQFALRRRQSPPDVICCECETERANASWEPGHVPLNVAHPVQVPSVSRRTLETPVPHISVTIPHRIVPPTPEDRMPVETPSIFSQVIQEHLELKRRNAELEGDMPLKSYEIEDPFDNHPLFKTEEQARLEETMDGTEPAVEVAGATMPWPGEQNLETPELVAHMDDSFWGRSRDFDWGD